MHDIISTPTALNPNDFSSTAAYVTAVKALTDPSAHHDDAAMAIEHAALFALVPRAEATHVAVRNGSWFDPATWEDGKVPGASAKVLIPEAISVNYDGVSDASLFTVRVDGRLLFAPDHDTRMVVDTLVVAKTGLLRIGTSDHPIQDGVTANIVIADNGPIDLNWDPLLLSRGVISHGSTEIHGQEKASFLKLAMDPLAGSTLLYFDEDAAQNGWHVGDKIVVTGTHIAPQMVNGDWLDVSSQDEARTIKAIYGTTIVLDQPLTYDHDSPRADLKAYVADYTRNVVIETQNADEVPVSQRGHVMFMHSPSVDVEYAEFFELGRTDKSTRAIDAATATGVTSDTNVKGRYALHLHETGVDPTSPETVVKGNAIWGSPGWGIVQHASSADIENNATFNTFGAAYVAETGDETGLWHNNIAIQAHGIGAGGDKNFDDVAAFDLARSGIGFYFQGRLIKTTDNVAAGVNEGFVYMVRGTPATIAADNLDQPEILHGLTSTDVAAAPIQNFTNNEVLAAAYGFIVVKADPAQDHDVRSVVEGFKAWETDIGIHLEYTAHYTFLDTDLTGPDIGRDFEPKGHAGIELGNNAIDIVFNRTTIANYRDGAVLDKALVGDPARLISTSDFNYVFIDLETHDIKNSAIRNFDPTIDKLLNSSQLGSIPATLQMDWQGDIPVWSFDWPDGRSVVLQGVKHDNLGTINYRIGNEVFNIGRDQMAGLLTHQGYYTTDDGRKIVVLEEYFSDRATGEIFKTSIPIQIADNVPLLQDQWFLLDGDAKWLGKVDLNAAAPVAAADTASTSQAASVVIDVLKNDTDPNGLAMSVDGITQPTHGTVTQNSDGTLTYTPNGDFVGTETFKYWATDHNAKFDDGIVTVNVRSGNVLPGETPPGDTPPGGAPSSPPGTIPEHDHDHPPTDVPPVIVMPTPPATPSNPSPVVHADHPHNDHRPGDTSAWEHRPDHTHSWMGWGYRHVHFEHQQYNHGFGEAHSNVGRAILAASADALKDLASYARAYNPLSAPSVIYEDFGGGPEAGSRPVATNDLPGWRPSSLMTSDILPSQATDTLDMHNEGVLGARALLDFDFANSPFIFRDLGDGGVDSVHSVEPGALPNMEHHNPISSGFIFA
ncbi:hypothetical protein CQ12_04135 [Bradyrhizobium jicamae]|uniref:G8 domain-containing protein n=1 Tax=Bradyrhizobium jicamae TaxID=280332 RepID=A0A0R3KFX9_9BRAD|nr:Ig-like domain-containing protein [Bradyrhizobium jicamae]KRQ94727.1 hypothetical protein CQ12_04135 [Bradyrhizobium jicamae]